VLRALARVRCPNDDHKAHVRPPPATCSSGAQQAGRRARTQKTREWQHRRTRSAPGLLQREQLPYEPRSCRAPPVRVDLRATVRVPRVVVTNAPDTASRAHNPQTRRTSTLLNTRAHTLARSRDYAIARPQGTPRAWHPRARTARAQAHPRAREFIHHIPRAVAADGRPAAAHVEPVALRRHDLSEHAAPALHARLRRRPPRHRRVSNRGQPADFTGQGHIGVRGGHTARARRRTGEGRAARVRRHQTRAPRARALPSPPAARSAGAQGGYTHAARPHTLTRQRARAAAAHTRRPARTTTPGRAQRRRRSPGRAGARAGARRAGAGIFADPNLSVPTARATRR
jgi:hypothetical protein